MTHSKHYFLSFLIENEEKEKIYFVLFAFLILLIYVCALKRNYKVVIRNFLVRFCGNESLNSLFCFDSNINKAVLLTRILL